MPCLILTGHPCVGKTTFAHALAERAVQHKSGIITSTVVINEESVCRNQSKSECYVDSLAEKSTRGWLKTEFDKYCSSSNSNSSKQQLIILDSSNYIKGYRYELHCISKAAGDRHGVVWILGDADQAKEWNRKRREDGASQSSRSCYESDDMMDALVQRFEPPDERNRWDKPLYKVDVASLSSKSVVSSDPTTPGGEPRTKSSQSNNSNSGMEKAADALRRSVYDMHNLSESINASNIVKNDTSENQESKTPKPKTTSASSSFVRKSSATGWKKRPKAITAKKDDTDSSITMSRPSANVPIFSLTAESLALANEVTHVPASAQQEGQGTHYAASRSKCQQQQHQGNQTTGVTYETLEQAMDGILDSFLLDIKPLKEGMSTQTAISANANVSKLIISFPVSPMIDSV
jgi:protein KTI12